jgi:hypothetical protein
MYRKLVFLVTIGFLATVFTASGILAQNPDGVQNYRSAVVGNMPASGAAAGVSSGGIRIADMNLVTLLQNEKVQNDMELVTDQISKLGELSSAMKTAEKDTFTALQGLSGDERRAKMQVLAKELKATIHNKLGDILLPRQLERLEQISLQVQGGAALFNADIVKTLKITKEQQDKLKALRDEFQPNMGMSLKSMPNESREQIQTRFTQAHENMLKAIKEHHDNLLDVLTQEQRDQFDKMQGAKIGLDFSTLMGPGPVVTGGTSGSGGGGGGGGGF